MIPDSFFKPLMALGVFAAALGVSQPDVACAAPDAFQVAVVGAASYDYDRDELLVPVTGGDPRVHVQQLSPRQFVADLTGCQLLGGSSMGNRLRYSPLAGWSLSSEPSLSAVRLRLTLREGVKPEARYDQNRGFVVFSFARRAEARTVKTAAAQTPEPVLPLRPSRPPLVGLTPKQVRGQAAELERTLAARPATQQAEAGGKSSREADSPAVAPKTGARPSGEVQRAALPTAPQAAAAGSDLKPVALVSHSHGAGLRAEMMGEATAGRRLLSRPVAMPLVLLAAANQSVVRRVPSSLRLVRWGGGTHKNRRLVKSTPHRLAARPLVRLGLPHVDQAEGHLVVPVLKGSLSAEALQSVRLNKRWSYIDVAGALPSFQGVRYEERPDFAFQRWVMARRPGQTVTRLSFASGVSVRLDHQLKQDALVVAVVPTEKVLANLVNPNWVAEGKPASTGNSDGKSISESRPGPVVAEAGLPAPSGEPRLEPIAPKDAVVRRNPAPAGVIETRLRRPFYDAERFGLAIPYEGRTPLFRWATKSANLAVIELKADVLSATHLQEEARRQLAWGSWKLSRRGRPGLLALEMSFTNPSEVSIAADPERKQLLVIPQPKLSQVAVAEGSAVRSSLSNVSVDTQGDNLFIPYQGEVPRYVIEQVTPTFAYVVFEAAALKDAGVQFQTPAMHPMLNYTLVTQPDGTSTVRLALSLTKPASTAVYQDPTNARLVVSFGQDVPVVQNNDTKALRVPEPWPGALREAPGVPTSGLQTNS
ncbi:MAG: hypothetical protein VKP62_07975 [Candidatus Sericytochromatia bacterium]|nr:hypothetical protein [Candidatus Sericytochromatia bacterium]